MIALMLVICFGAAQTAYAHVQALEGHLHEPGTTYTSVGLHANGVDVLFTIPREDAIRLAPGEPGPGELRSAIVAGISVEGGDSPCVLADFTADEYGAIDAYQFELDYRCPTMDVVDLGYSLFPGESHVNHLEIWLAGNVFSTAFDERRRILEVPVVDLLRERGWQMPEDPPELPGRKPSLWQYLDLGFDHVVSGYDHLAFVLGLVLLVARFGPLVGLVTSFTIAHSITLGLAAFDVFVLPGAITEPLIALSIVYIGLENLWSLWNGAGRPGTSLAATALGRRWASSFGFGLVHGFGFSFLLREVGLPPESLVPSLALFNAGVELAQLSVVVLPFIVLQLALRQRPAFVWVASALSVGITAVGMFWLLEGWL